MDGGGGGNGRVEGRDDLSKRTGKGRKSVGRMESIGEI